MATGRKLALVGKVCIVTGATRGVGKGIALQLGEAGATVYITGRTLSPKSGDPVGGSLNETAQEIENRGGTCVPVQCDHTKDEDIQRLFERVSKEQNGQLDVLVNNAYAAVKAIADSIGKPFWEQPLSIWDDVNNVGLRNHYLCSVEAAKMMVPRKQGLIVNISSPGGLKYLFNVSYGVGKEACDRMAADCAHELRKHNVTFVSLWPGLVRTENLVHIVNTKGTEGYKKTIPVKFEVDINKMLDNGETPEFAGKAVAALASDPNVFKKTGRILVAAELGQEYGFKDINGKSPKSIRQLNGMLEVVPKLSWLSYVVPNFIKIPCWMLALAGNKF